MPKKGRPSKGQQRRILCTNCDEPLLIAAGAKSVSCTSCHKRVITEAAVIKEYVAVRKYYIANDMHIRKKGLVYASLRAESIRIDGFLQGDALAMVSIYVSKTAKINGDLRAPSIKIEKGATITGTIRVGAKQVPELKNLMRDASGESIEPSRLH